MKSVKALLQFATILPLGRPADFEHFARRSYLYPVAGYVIGGITAFVVFWIGNPAMAAALAVTLVLLLSGCNHFDGLLDFGDALMAHGDRGKRIAALTDRHVGAGGVALGTATSLLLYAGLSSSASIPAAILIGEVCAKFGMAFLTATGRPFSEGTHSYLHSFSRPYYPAIALLLCLPLILLPLSLVHLAVAAILMLGIPVLLLAISNRLFGGVNGDVVGASNEIIRAAVVLGMAFV